MSPCRRKVGSFPCRVSWWLDSMSGSFQSWLFQADDLVLGQFSPQTRFLAGRGHALRPTPQSCLGNQGDHRGGGLLTLQRVTQNQAERGWLFTLWLCY